MSRTSPGRAQDRRLRAEARAAKAAERTPLGRFRRRVGWPLCLLGFTWFAATYVANFAGVVLLPFDHHHIFGQIGGLVMGITGLVWATS